MQIGMMRSKGTLIFGICQLVSDSIVIDGNNFEKSLIFIRKLIYSKTANFIYSHQDGLSLSKR